MMLPIFFELFAGLRLIICRPFHFLSNMFVILLDLEEEGIRYRWSK